jgi:hypothetical protein
MSGEGQVMSEKIERFEDLIAWQKAEHSLEGFID